MMLSNTIDDHPINVPNKNAVINTQLTKKSLTISSHHIISLGNNQYAYLPILIPLPNTTSRNETIKVSHSGNAKKMKKQKKKCRCRRNFKKGIKQRIVDIYYEVIAAHPYLSIRSASKVIYDRLSKDEYIAKWTPSWYRSFVHSSKNILTFLYNFRQKERKDGIYNDLL